MYLPLEIHLYPTKYLFKEKEDPLPGSRKHVFPVRDLISDGNKLIAVIQDKLSFAPMGIPILIKSLCGFSNEALITKHGLQIKYNKVFPAPILTFLDPGKPFSISCIGFVNIHFS